MVHPLKEFREGHNPRLTQADLAERLGVEKSTVWRWESDKRKIGMDLLPRVSEVTGIAPWDLRPDLADLMKVAEGQEPERSS